jgi:hypothetical protein
VKRILIAALAALALVYVADFASVLVRMLHPKPDNPFETVTALRILAIAEKNGKTEYTIDQLQPQQTAVCVHALFPHNSDPPCWYLKRKFAQPIPMSIWFFPWRGNSKAGFYLEKALAAG